MGVDGLRRSKDSNPASKITGTGINATYGSGVQEQDQTEYPRWTASVEKLEVLVGGAARTAQIYPLDTDDLEEDPFDVVRSFRFDSTVASPSTSGSQLTITIKAKFKFVKWEIVAIPVDPYFLPVATVEYETFDLAVTPTVFNVMLANATSSDNQAGSGLPGWQNMNPIDPQYYWSAVSQDMATAAVGKAGSAGYVALTPTLHEKEDLVLPASPPGDPLDKLIRQSTCYFNSSHGQGSGFSDKQLDIVEWSDVDRTSGHYIVNKHRDLVNRIVWLYSCSCGVSSPASAFHIGGSNTAVFGFNNIVFSTLINGNASNDEPYNDANGNLVMTDKLTGHVNSLLGNMANGMYAGFALDTANNNFPPRRFSHGASGINYMDVMNMAMSGDTHTTWRTIFIGAASVNTETHFQFGNWGLVTRQMTGWPITP